MLLLLYIKKTEKHLKMNKEVRMLLPKKDLIQVEYGKLIIIMRISTYLLITTPTSHTHLLLTTPTSHTHIFHPLSKIVIHNSAHPYCTEVWITILESGWNLWVWLVGVVSRRWVWLVGVVIRRYVDIYPHNNYKFSILHLY